MRLQSIEINTNWKRKNEEARSVFYFLKTGKIEDISVYFSVSIFSSFFLGF